MNYFLQILALLFSIFLVGQESKKEINDEYLYLENSKLDKTINWIEKENDLTSEYLDKIARKYNFKNKIIDYIDLSTNAMPTKIGSLFFSKYIKDKNTPASLFYRKSLDDTPTELFNVYKIYKNPNTIISNFYPSKNGLKVGLIIDKGGSDLKFTKFVDLNSKKVYDEELKDIKFSNLIWNNDKGVFYKKNSNTNKMEKDSTYTIFYHEIGTKQEEDKIIYNVSDKEKTSYFFSNKFNLYLVEINSENTQKIFSSSLTNVDFDLKLLCEIKQVNNIIKIDNSSVIYSSLNSDWGDIRIFNINTKEEKILIPQMNSYLLESTSFYENYIFCKYKTKERKYLSIYTDQGIFIKKFETPIGMDFDIKFYDSTKKKIYASFYSQILSYYNLILNVETGKISNHYNDYIIQKPNLFPFDYFITKKVTYKSKDSKEIPITIIHKKNTVLNGENPTILEAYGGFGIVSNSNFDPGLLSFLEKGGVYAFAEIRGGGEYGKQWHKNGKGKNKMNCFNDFISAAEFLIQEKYTNPNKLAITGTSHGGLVVGVALTQRPELFKVAIPKMGVFDMLRFDKYTVGHYHTNEFGNPNIAEEANYLAKYSPYHNIKTEINYPTTLIITAENDDRVPPLHSYKFAAKLKNRTAQKNSIYLSVLKDSGHNGKVATRSEFIKDESNFYSFIYEELTKHEE